MDDLMDEQLHNPVLDDLLRPALLVEPTARVQQAILAAVLQPPSRARTAGTSGGCALDLAALVLTARRGAAGVCRHPLLVPGRYWRDGLADHAVLATHARARSCGRANARG